MSLPIRTFYFKLNVALPAGNCRARVIDSSAVLPHLFGHSGYMCFHKYKADKRTSFRQIFLSSARMRTGCGIPFALSPFSRNFRRKNVRWSDDHQRTKQWLLWQHLKGGRAPRGFNDRLDCCSSAAAAVIERTLLVNISLNVF